MSDTPSRALVLIVEDEPALRRLFSEWLDEFYDVRTASTGAEAFAQLDDAVDVVTLDRQLPDCSGEEILTEIQARNMNCHVVMVTGVPPDTDIPERRVDDYLVKPVSRDELQRAVNAACTRVKCTADV